MRQLQTWWDAHAYYPRHASNNDEGGTSLDTAGDSVFRGGFVRPFPEGEPKADTDISLHYVLAHRHDQSVAAGYTPVSSKSPFTITNDPVKSPILDTMLLRTCTGTLVLGGIPNHPIYGMRSWAQTIFLRKPDGAPWVMFYERGYPSLSPVTKVGKRTVRQKFFGSNSNFSYWLQYTIWPDGEDRLSGAIGTHMVSSSGVVFNRNPAENSIDLTCATEALTLVRWNDWLAQSLVTSPFNLSSSDPT
jgi:hypothetical protein